jgi:FAD/FMN-containing dehydrogenase
MGQTSSFEGATVTPDDARYPTLIRGFNLRWVGSPRYVAVCGSTEQVASAVRKALETRLRLTVRGGGHCYEDFVSCNKGGVILDLSGMTEVYRDTDGTFCVEGGATLWNVYERLAKLYGLTLPGGSCYSVGVGGHVPAGGYGLLSRLYGLTVDYLYAVEVVCVDRNGSVQTVKVSLDSTDPDERLLLWAHTGGGGGNFGVITRFWFRDLPAAPELAVIDSQAWNWGDLQEDHFVRLVSAYGEWMVSNSDPGGSFDGLFALLHLNQNAGATPQIVLTAQSIGAKDDALREFFEAITRGLPASGHPTAPAGHHQLVPPSATGQVLPWLFAAQTLNGSGPNRRGKYKSAYMNGNFPPKQLEALWRGLHAPTSSEGSQCLVQIDSYGGRINAIPSDQTAVAQRSSVMKLQFQAYWTNEADDSQNLSWIRGLYDEMYGPEGPLPDGLMDGCYVGYPDVDLSKWQHLYYKGHYETLQRAKKRWDPLNVFHHRQSIELPS